MKIPTNLTPLGPEMAFEMPDGEVLPMWVRDSDIEPWRIAGIKSFDGRWASTSIGTQWFKCALLDGHPIPESELPKKTDRLMTHRERSEFTPTERRDRVWELAARMAERDYLLTDEQCVDMAESLMVEFEATYNNEGA